MARIRSCWVVGSVELLPQQDLTIEGSSETIPAGPYFLFHDDPAVSLIAQMLAAMLSAGVAAPVVELLENRRVRLGSSGVFTVTWGSATALRDFLGFTGNLAAADSYEAPNISRFLWSPGIPPNKETPTDAVGFNVEDAEIKVSADGNVQEVDFHTTHVWDEWEWDAVLLNRYLDPTGFNGGTWDGFRTAVIVPGHRFQLYEIVVEDSSSSSTVVLPAALGTYKIRVIPKAAGKRKIANANVRWRVSMRVREATPFT